MSKYLIYTILISTCSLFATIDLTVSGGNWSKILYYTDISEGPGGDFQYYYESGASNTTINISGCSSTSDRWEIQAKITAIEWHDSLNLSLKRTSDGTGSGSIDGGSSYIELTTSYQTIFSGMGSRDGISLQQKVSGTSVSLSAEDYQIEITYIVNDLTDSKFTESNPDFFEDDSHFSELSKSDRSIPHHLRSNSPINQLNTEDNSQDNILKSRKNHNVSK